MTFDELKEIAKRVEKSGSIRSSMDTECINRNISMSNNLVITRLVIVYRKYRNGTITKSEAEAQQEEIKAMWEGIKDKREGTE